MGLLVPWLVLRAVINLCNSQTLLRVPLTAALGYVNQALETVQQAKQIVWAPAECLKQRETRQTRRKGKLRTQNKAEK